MQFFKVILALSAFAFALAAPVPNAETAELAVRDAEAQPDAEPELDARGYAPFSVLC